MRKRLAPSFYLRSDVVEVSRDLLGKYLVTSFDGVETAGMIVETEAYRAPDDKACHAWNNRRTKRTETLFAEGGHAYVYLCYGIHHLFNVVTGPTEMAQAVLIRAIEPTDNLEMQLARRGRDKVRPQLTAGPGVMSKALGIRKEHDAINMLAADSPIWLEDRGVEVAQIASGPRVGVAYAAECAEWPWRFWIADSPWVSKWKK